MKEASPWPAQSKELCISNCWQNNTESDCIIAVQRFAPALASAGAFHTFSSYDSVVMVLPQRGQMVPVPAQVVPQLEHWLSREGRTGFTGPHA